MDSLVAAYLVGWLAISSYVAWLAVQQRSLALRVEELQSSRDEVQPSSQQHVRAA
jgi:CcmD family protein